MNPQPDLSRLARRQEAGSHAPGASGVPMPAFSWRTRVLLPALVLGGAALLLAYAGWSSLRGAVAVRVVPVVSRQVEGGEAQPGAAAVAGDQPVAQAPGWVEPDPFPLNVPALAEGVVKEVLVLEGQAVAAGQVVARLIDDDARLALAAAEGELSAASAEVDEAAAELEAAQSAWDNPYERVRAVAAAEAMVAESRAELELHDAKVALEQAKLAEARDEFERLKKSSRLGAGAEGEVARAGLRAATQERAVEEIVSHRGVVAAQLARREAELAAARDGLRLRIEEKRALAAARASSARAQARLLRATAARDEAALRLERMEVRSPAAGTVMARLVEPGARLMLQSDVPGAAVAVRLYDPSRLQVRVDIPLADAAKVGVGYRAEVTTEALPDRVFRGVVTRRVDEANLQKNTVQVKVAIQDPSPVLRPEMLARVRFFAPAAAERRAAGGGGSVGSSRPFVAADALMHRSGDQAHAWVVDRRREVAVLRTVTLGGGTHDGWLEVVSGLNPGDRVIVDGRDRLSEGTPVRVMGESGGTGPGHEGHMP